MPQSGPSWPPEGQPVRQPHESVRGGTAKRLTRFRPATGEIRATPVEHATNAVLHPWLKGELEAILEPCPPAPVEATPGRRWSDWDDHADASLSEAYLPPARILLIWDDRKGHLTSTLIEWCARRGMVPV